MEKVIEQEVILTFEELEAMETPANMDPWVAGWVAGGAFGTGLAIGAGIAIAT
ncbi:hypothetical protein [Bacillus thuringiensis]|uniref:hypothetical protein n=1 Tax=Bacillus thuringiensis TaxID=1428 RepID=UPI001592C06E|nr:hypothetical protein [Bacillus thuringiensis]MCU4957514.1 hypothetical protein [Bacillus cereus]MED3180882.1 hypothetical protein [Bacillus thuringiensis]